MTRRAVLHEAHRCSRAENLMGWRPRHRLEDKLPAVVENRKADPEAWYEAKRITPPPWVEEDEKQGSNPDELRQHHEALVRRQHRDNRWAHFINMALGLWLVTQPVMIQVEEPLLFWSEVTLGAALIVFAGLSLSWQMQWARWICAGIGALVIAVPFLFWTEHAAAFLSDTLVGALVFGFAVGTRPAVGPSQVAAPTCPEVPPGRPPTPPP